MAEKLIPLTTLLKRKIKEVQEIEKHSKGLTSSDIYYSEGLTHWWYDPEYDEWQCRKSAGAPYYPKDAKWVYVARTNNSKIII